MAQIIQSKYPIDTEARKAVGFGFPLNGNAVFNPNYQTRDQIKANLLNYLLTNRGERVFNPEFGANLRSLLYENMVDSTLEDLKDRIQEDITQYFPQVKVLELKFIKNPDQNTLNFILTYDIIFLGIEDNLNLLIQ